MTPSRTEGVFAFRFGVQHFRHPLDPPLRAVAAEAGTVLFVATVFVCLLFSQVVTAIGSTVIGRGSDSLGTVWWLYSLQHEGGYHLFGETHHVLTGAPFGWDGPNGLNIQWLLPYYPAYLATKIVGPVAAHNLVLLSGYVLSGAAMYLLVRYLRCNRLVAGWAGLVYIVFPWHLVRAVHASLVHLEVLPLLLLALLAAARTPTWHRFVLIAAATIACWLTSGYFGAMAVVGAAAFAIGVAFSKARCRIRLLLLGSIASTLGASLLVAALSELAGVGRGAGLHRTSDNLAPWGLHPVELVVPAAGNFVFGHWTGPFFASRQHHSYPIETTNFLGLLTIALAVTWLILAWRRRSALGRRLRLATAGLTAVVVAALLLALPSPVSIFGHDVWMPSQVLWQIVPPFRLPARWTALALTALVPLGALALQEAATRASRFGWQWKGVKLVPMIVVIGAMVVSFLELAVNPAASRFSTKEVPAEYMALSRTPRGIVAEYPLLPQLDYFFWQIVHHRPMLTTDAFGTPADDQQHALVNPSTPGTAQQLALLGVTTIVTHPRALRWSPGPFPPNPNEWGPGYRLVARAPDSSSVWAVVARRAPALVAAVSGFTAPEPLQNGTPAYALISSSGVGYLSIRAKKPSVARLSFQAEPPKNAQRVLRLADSSNEQPFTLRGRSRISLLVEIPRGFSLILVKTDPAPTSRADAIVLSKIRFESASGTPELRAVLEDADPGF